MSSSTETEPEPAANAENRHEIDEPAVGWGRALLPLGIILAVAVLLVIGSLIYRTAS